MENFELKKIIKLLKQQFTQNYLFFHDSVLTLKPRVYLTCLEKWSCGLFDRPLVVGCSTGHKPRPLHVNEWDLSQNKKNNYTSNTIFQNMVLVI